MYAPLCYNGGMKNSSSAKVSKDHSDILAAEIAEIGRQETRTDNKATHIITLSGILLTFSIASIGFISTFIPTDSWLILLPGVPLLASTIFWISTIVELLRHVLRPSLDGSTGSGFINPDRYEYFKTTSLEEYRLQKVRFLNELLVSRYTSLRRAVNLLLVGFVCIGASLIGAILLIQLWGHIK
jgi:hypothetical protein